MPISYAARVVATLVLAAPLAGLPHVAAQPTGDAVAPAASCGTWLDGPEWSTHGIVSASNERGRTFVAWKAQSASRDEPTEAAHGRFISRSGRLGPIMELAPEQPVAGAVSVAMDRRGDVLVTFGLQAPPVDRWRAWTRRVTRDGRLGPLHQLSEDTRDYLGPRAALTPRGRGVVTVDIPARDGLPARIDVWDVGRAGAPRLVRQVVEPDLDHVVALAGGGSEDVYALLGGTDDVAGYLVRAGRARPVDVTGGVRGTVAQAALGVDTSGRAHLLLDTGLPFQPTRVAARTWDGRSLGRVRSVGRMSTTLMGGELDVDATGAGPAYWSTGLDRSTFELTTAHLPARGRLTRVRDLGAPDTYPALTNVDFPVSPAAGIDSRGEGLLAWKPEDDDSVTGDETLTVRSIGSDGRLGRRLHTFGVTHDVVVLAPDGGRPMLARTADVGAGLTRVCLERRRW
jgi:hypothetical protein